jgi:hypothetical protein
MDKVILENTAESLHWSTIITGAFSGHGCSHLEMFHQPVIFLGALLTPMMRMVDQTCSKPFACHCPEQRMNQQGLGDTAAHCVSDDISREDVLMPWQIKPSFFRP